MTLQSFAKKDTGLGSPSNPQTTISALHNFGLLAVVSAAIALAGGLAPNAQAALVGPGGYTNSFNTQPVMADWSTMAPPGSATTWGSVVSDIDTAVAATSADMVNQ